MSIEKIKSYIDILETGGRIEVIDVLKSVLDVLLEQHKENEKTYTVAGFDGFKIQAKQTSIESPIMVNITYDDPVVEVGQVWRYQNTSLAEVISIANHGVRLKFEQGHQLGRTFEDLFDDYELVTMENITLGEWAKRLPNGDKMKVDAISRDPEGDMLVFSDGYTCVYRDSGLFKPCLPPVEEQQKLYTQEEYDKMNKESYELGFNTALSMIERNMNSLRP